MATQYIIAPALFIILCFNTSLDAKGSKTKSRTSVTPSTQAVETETLLNVNNLSTWQRADGQAELDPAGNSGFTYPRGTAQALFQSGLIWGGIVNDPDPTKPQLRVGGQTHLIGTTAGWIETPGPNPIPTSELSELYRIRRDWQSLTLNSQEVILDAAEKNGISPSQVTEQQKQEVLDQYADAWANWPADRGAPYYDLNNNGQWDAGVDEPGLENADQVLWTVCHDLDPLLTDALYGSPPTGIEMQITTWGYKDGGARTEALYRRYRLINKSGFDISKMYLASWSDPDIGDYTDDLVGNDQALQSGYAYNGFASDDEYVNYALPPSAVAHTLLQGPIVPSSGGRAIFDFKQRNGYVNLPVGSFGYSAAGSPIGDPLLGDYNGTLAWYNWLRGYQPSTDTLNVQPYLYGSGPNVGQITTFPLDGDPVNSTGDIDGTGSNLPANDRRFTLNSGPFTFAAGDTQEIVIAITAGIDPAGTYLDAISVLKQNISEILANYGAGIVGIEDIIAPSDFTLDQNYPNPFNPTTQISFSLEKPTKVTLDVLNPLGQRIRTLVSKQLAPGSHAQTWDGHDENNYRVGSGVYFYRLTAGDQQKVRKMILLR